ncbi:CAAX amino protease family protein [Dorea sp. D27]|nr:CAAX amino protease family protein [Dorea sp. D27]
MSAHYDAAMKAMENQEQMMNLYNAILEELMKWQTAIEGIAAFITIPVMLIFFHKDRVKERAAGILPNKKAPIWKYSAVLLMSVAMCWGLNNLIAISGVSAISGTYEETMEILYTPPLLIQVICLGILVPICEELVFRGLMFKRMRARAGYLQSAIYSSVVFAILHVNLVQMIYSFVLGLMLAYIYEKYGSIKAPVAAHVVMNIFSVLATKYELLDWLAADIMRIGIVTVVCAAVAATMFVFIQRIEERPDYPNKPGENENLAAI